ncbi:MAG: dTMP kinase [Elusimicrobia bacterium]|nr:dTMP kinase [Candidatus Liberimonas magnetica]
MHIKKGLFITFEGGDGSGKSTQLELLVKYIKDKKNFGYNGVISIREPGGSNISDNIRKILLNPEYSVDPLAELLLYEANRAQNVKYCVIPNLENNIIVICDRFTDSTLAYQGYARGLDLKMIKTLNTIAAHGIIPDLTIYLDFPIKNALQKARGLRKESYENGDRIEREDICFHNKVRDGFLTLAKSDPERIKVINVAEEINETHKKIVSVVNRLLKSKTKDKCAI